MCEICDIIGPSWMEKDMMTPSEIVKLQEAGIGPGLHEEAMIEIEMLRSRGVERPPKWIAE